MDPRTEDIAEVVENCNSYSRKAGLGERGQGSGGRIRDKGERKEGNRIEAAAVGDSRSKVGSQRL